jgi:DNA-binding protein HU-beta
MKKMTFMYKSRQIGEQMRITSFVPMSIERFWEEVNVMNKTDLVNAVAEKSDLSKKDATKAVDAVFESVMDSLKNGDKVQLIGFGNFEVRERSARKGRNPQTGEEIEIPASKVPAFKPGKALKDIVK